jgi:hypothetical protein
LRNCARSLCVEHFFLQIFQTVAQSRCGCPSAHTPTHKFPNPHSTVWGCVCVDSIAFGTPLTNSTNVSVGAGGVVKPNRPHARFAVFASTTTKGVTYGSIWRRPPRSPIDNPTRCVHQIARGCWSGGVERSLSVWGRCVRVLKYFHKPPCQIRSHTPPRPPAPPIFFQNAY